MVFPPKLALSHILLSFVVAGWSRYFCAVFGVLEWAVGARAQSSQPFSTVSFREAKVQQIFALEFPQIAQVTNRRDPMFTLAVIRHIRMIFPKSRKHCNHSKSHCRVSGDVSSIPRPDHCPQHVASQRKTATSVQVHFLPRPLIP